MKPFSLTALIPKKIKHNSSRFIVPMLFSVLCLIGFLGADVSLGFLKRELSFRLVANGMTVLALLIPIYAGMGLNFSLVVGAIVSQAAVIFATDRLLEGGAGLLTCVLVSALLSIIAGGLIGLVLNRSRGREMITSIVIGFVGSSLYQLIFMVGYGTVIHPKNEAILLSSGKGIRNMIDLYPYKLLLDQFPWLPYALTLACALFIFYIMHTRLGAKIQAVGQDYSLAQAQGIDADRMRLVAIILSTLFAGQGHLLYMFSMGNMNVYSGHLNLDVFACAALLAGGATLKQASVVNAFIGLILFHTLFIVSPLAAQNFFSNVAIGEYFRSFVAYGVIVAAFIINLRCAKQQAVEIEA